LPDAVDHNPGSVNFAPGSSLGFVERTENVILLGPSGTGKTHLAIAFGLIAAQKRWKVRFLSAADLVIALEAVQRQGRIKEVMNRTVAMPKLLIAASWQNLHLLTTAPLARRFHRRQGWQRICASIDIIILDVAR
jgi:ABC-type uncharacterized transport system YnjBCD ATPase subunit